MPSEREGAKSGNALLIFVKYPSPGTVKTRLSPELTPEQGAAFYRALAEEVVQVHISDAGYESIVCFSPGALGGRYGPGWARTFAYGVNLGMIWERASSTR